MLPGRKLGVRIGDRRFLTLAFSLFRPGIVERFFGDAFVLEVFQLQVEDALDELGGDGDAVHVEGREDVLDQACLIDRGNFFVVVHLYRSYLIRRRQCRLGGGEPQLFVPGMGQVVGQCVLFAGDGHLDFSAALDEGDGRFAGPNY